MKNYNEMANDVLRRIGEYETLQRKRRNDMKKVILPICCFCLVALLGISLWKGDLFANTPSVESNNSTVAGEKDYVEPSENNQSSDNREFVGMVKYGGANYVQCSTSTTVYTPDKYLGEAYDFEGTFQLKAGVGGIYSVKDDPNVLMVELKNGEYTDYVILMKEQAE